VAHRLTRPDRPFDRCAEFVFRSRECFTPVNLTWESERNNTQQGRQERFWHVYFEHAVRPARVSDDATRDLVRCQSLRPADENDHEEG